MHPASRSRRRHRRSSKKSTLGRLLGSEARAKILEALLLGSPARYYVRQLASRLGLPPTAVSRELAHLAELGVARREADGRRVYYEANPNAAGLSELRSLVLKLGGVAEVLRAALAEERASICWAFVFGSIAEGSATAASDVDLFVVGSIAPIELHERLRPISEALGRAINSHVLTPREFREKRARNPFVTRVLEGPKLQLIGNAPGAQATD